MEKGAIVGMSIACIVSMFVVMGRGAKEERLRIYLHDNAENKNASFNTATVEVQRSPTMSTVANQFGKLYIFDDPLTDGPSMSSPHIGSAQGMYAYTGRGNISAFWAFTAFLGERGSLSFMGAEVIVGSAPRILNVVGGTGEFALARGIVTLNTIAFHTPTYFVLSLDIALHLP
eukprot:c24699_g1_i1 orf=39-560(+)